MIPTKNDLPLATRQKMAKLLNQVLADGSDLYSQAKQAHWNVKGIHFIALHELFDGVAAAIFPFIDEVAERVVQLGGVAQGTVRMAASSSSLDEYPAGAEDGIVHVTALSSAISKFGRTVRKGIDTAADAKDIDSSDLLTGLSRELDKQLWFVEAHAQGHDQVEQKKTKTQNA